MTRLLFILAAFCLSLPFSGAGVENPNIVYILADDMSYDSVSALNS